MFNRLLSIPYDVRPCSSLELPAYELCSPSSRLRNAVAQIHSNGFRGPVQVFLPFAVVDINTLDQLEGQWDHYHWCWPHREGMIQSNHYEILRILMPFPPFTFSASKIIIMSSDWICTKLHHLDQRVHGQNSFTSGPALMSNQWCTARPTAKLGDLKKGTQSGGWLSNEYLLIEQPKGVLIRAWQ